MQLDDAQRGFSVGKSAPLDMRMDPAASGAAPSRSSRRQANASWPTSSFITARSGRPVASRARSWRGVASGGLPNTTSDFAAFVSAVVQRPGKRERIHPATRVFQALRIAVNDELGALRDGLQEAVGRLRARGRLVAISFHSLEDRIVKRTLARRRPPRDSHQETHSPQPGEIAENRRSRSAKLRAAARKAS